MTEDQFLDWLKGLPPPDPWPNLRPCICAGVEVYGPHVFHDHALTGCGDWVPANCGTCLDCLAEKGEPPW